MKECYKVDFPQYLKKKRSEKGLTLRELASKVGVSAGYISRIEQGSSTPNESMIKSLGNVLGFKLSDVTGVPEEYIETIALEDLFEKYNIEINGVCLKGAQIGAFLEMINYLEKCDWADTGNKIEYVNNILTLVDCYKKERMN